MTRTLLLGFGIGSTERMVAEARDWQVLSNAIRDLVGTGSTWLISRTFCSDAVFVTSSRSNKTEVGGGYTESVSVSVSRHSNVEEE